MSENTRLNPGEGGDLYAADELATVNGAAAEAGLKVQRVKVGFGPDGEYRDASETQPLPTAEGGELLQAIKALRMAVHSLSRNVGMAYPDVAGRLRVNVETGTLIATQATAANLNATVSLAASQVLATLTNQAQLGGNAANDQVPALMHLQADSLRRNISVT